jgi:hypothetical protein
MAREEAHEMRTVEFIVSGDSGHECSQALKKLYLKWLETGSALLGSPGKGRVRVRVVITRPTRDTSVEHSMRYACGELEDEIIMAGGTIWDGTHVQITSELANNGMIAQRITQQNK